LRSSLGHKSDRLAPSLSRKHSVQRRNLSIREILGRNIDDPDFPGQLIAHGNGEHFQRANLQII
jgi:hypothetical protein